MLNAVIDISHWNGPNLDFVKAKAAGILGVFHKATQGLSASDPMFTINRQKILDAGLLFGVYHFGVNADGSDQADLLLTSAKPDSKTLIALDYEPNPKGGTMTEPQAEDFLAHLKSMGRSPILYSGAAMPKPSASNLTTVPLWWAQYNSVPSRAWRLWTFWQFTDGAHGPGDHSVDGIGHCDRDQFNGDESQLRALWTPDAFGGVTGGMEGSTST